MKVSVGVGSAHWWMASSRPVPLWLWLGPNTHFSQLTPGCILRTPCLITYIFKGPALSHSCIPKTCSERVTASTCFRPKQCGHFKRWGSLDSHSPTESSHRRTIAQDADGQLQPYPRPRPLRHGGRNSSRWRDRRYQSALQLASSVCSQVTCHSGVPERK